MKIAVISDIHGNMEALNAVMEDIQAKGCDKIFALGDYAMAGPEPSKAVNWFMTKEQDENFVMIQGNTDAFIGNYSEKLYEEVKEKAPVMAEALKSDVEILDSPQKEFLKNLPAQLEVEEDGVKFLLCHGSPRKNSEDILPDTEMEEVEKMLEHVEASVVLCGHTHIPCGFQTTTRQTVVNVGSVGRPFTERPDSCWLQIMVEGGKCVFEHKFVEYDREKASKTLSKRGFEGADKLAATLLDPKERHF